MARTKSNTLPKRFTPQFWDQVDGRLSIYREIQCRYQELIEDCGADSAQKTILAQRAVFISIQLESMEVAASTGGEFDLGVYTQGVNALSGLLSKLGLQKKSPNAVDIKSYVNERKGRR